MKTAKPQPRVEKREPVFQAMGWRGEGLFPGEERTFALTSKVSMNFCWCPPGQFLMGCPVSEEGRSDHETQHPVWITHGFWIAKYPVTQEQWSGVMGKNPSRFKKSGPTAPVETVSWLDICGNEKRTGGFLGTVNKRAPTGWRFDLPTEAQWEYACRAGTTGPFNVDGARLADLGWYAENSDSQTHPVGEKKPNAWGLHDMHGNVWEWCRDWYEAYDVSKTLDPDWAKQAVNRVYRGGSWFHLARRCRSAIRFRLTPRFRCYYLGFRPVRSVV